MKLTPITPAGGMAYRTPRLRPGEADFSEGWAPYTTWSHSLTLYREGSRVYLQGFLRCLTPSREILKLPNGFRSTTPQSLTLMRLLGDGPIARVDVDDTMKCIRWESITEGGMFYIEGSWRTEDSPPIVMPFIQG